MTYRSNLAFRIASDVALYVSGLAIAGIAALLAYHCGVIGGTIGGLLCAAYLSGVMRRETWQQADARPRHNPNE